MVHTTKRGQERLFMEKEGGNRNILIFCIYMLYCNFKKNKLKNKHIYLMETIIWDDILQDIYEQFNSCQTLPKLKLGLKLGLVNGSFFCFTKKTSVY